MGLHILQIQKNGTKFVVNYYCPLPLCVTIYTQYPLVFIVLNIQHTGLIYLVCQVIKTRQLLT